jgi:gamma-glutamyl-gamma-aminobutyrate hydrolase PuuD
MEIGITKILVINPDNRSLVPYFSQLGEVTTDKNDFLDNPKDFDLIVFCGGTDISPQIYGSYPYRKHQVYDRNRDMEEVFMFQVAKRFGIPMTGICRGMQFLGCMLGGTLVQHMTGHHGGVKLVVYEENGDSATFDAACDHHQMLHPDIEAASVDIDIIAWAQRNLSKTYILNEKDTIEEIEGEVEAICSLENKVFAVQYHPEWMGKENEGYQWYLQALTNFLVAQKGTNESKNMVEKTSK